MKSLSPFPERLHEMFQASSGGVVALVDRVLELCREQALQFDWHADCCRVRPLGAVPQEAIKVQLPKSVFRAMLARVAALCNEHVPESVSPYGGEAELLLAGDPPALFHVAFLNTSAEQSLEVRGTGPQRC